MLAAARPEASCARRDRFRQQNKEKKQIMQSFTELPLSPYTQERLSSLNFSIPTPVQAAAIPQALAGKDVLAPAQTGTGKPLAFVLPIIERLLHAGKPGVDKSGIA